MQTLGIPAAAIAGWRVFKRSFDAHRKPIQEVYIVDVDLAQPGAVPALLNRFAGHPHIQATPDMVWRMPVRAPSDWLPPGRQRPVVVGFGPCGIFAADSDMGQCAAGRSRPSVPDLVADAAAGRLVLCTVLALQGLARSPHRKDRRARPRLKERLSRG